ncbi:Gfo/Idh/MocA family protein [Pedobacter flavus]|uniref:Gfo/Idh/MocA family oxidoreductase n=1 Tax=Pedobacter flavus TaxID=3113906 RepID=A0ABU7H0E3_9SPHI|nr:Gfo/Idh/MocA family oxidoreductase [Pedobacter sp. VNH31]MEE1884801.1 Gfo/Idh/MocA family oxidoreductase [Pedobacter sp. VNH31]
MSAEKKIKILVVGCGNMGTAHATAYHNSPEFEICGLVSRNKSKEILNQKLNSNYPLFSEFYEALKITKPDAVCISTYPDTHEAYAIEALNNGCHVFIEKPLADSVEGALKIAEAAKNNNKKLLVGYILRYHPSWNLFTEKAKEMGKPLVMRMNLNQQSQGAKWNVHKNLMNSLSPIVDCAVHYIDIMCQMTRSKPIRVSAIGANLSPEIPSWNYNYGQLQITFEDGSVGWYESGWGPMVSDTAFFIKDVFGPKGSVSIVAKEAAKYGNSDNIDDHTKTESIKIHYADLNQEQLFSRKDEWLDLTDEPNHQELCNREQQFFLEAIKNNYDLTLQTEDAINSLKIAFACDESVKKGNTIDLKL